MSDYCFYGLVSQVLGSEVRKKRILAALTSSNIVKDIIQGKNIEQAASLFQESPLSLGLYDAFALAGLLVPGKLKNTHLSWSILTQFTIPHCPYSLRYD
jgi:hypothetical protein